jgi:XTP/dITP diphosphohydrolase
MRQILLATTNPHKVEEIRAILAPLGIAIRSLDSLASVPEEPEEDEMTFQGNARLKARYYAGKTGLTCLAEDSGLEVDALSGAPGVHSARYSGTAGTRAERDRANNEKLLRELSAFSTAASTAARTARFVCAMSVARPDGSLVAEAIGTYDGEIAEAPRGENGFGYDPLLYLPDVRRTSAELSAAEKNARSHRGKAARSLAALLAAAEE